MNSLSIGIRSIAIVLSVVSIGFTANLHAQPWPEIYRSVNPYNHVRDAFLSDQDSDGDLDIIYWQVYESIWSAEVNRLKWLENDGTGNFSRTAADVEIPDVDQLFPEDLDMDGDIDLVLRKFREVWFQKDKLYILRNDGFGEYAYTDTFELYEDTLRVEEVKLADWNEDGYPDIIYNTLENSNAVGLLFWQENDGGGRFLESRKLVRNGDDIKYTDFGDLDMDGDLDIAFVNHWQSNHDNNIDTGGWYENIGTDSFIRHELLIQPPSSFQRPFINDYDQDGQPDIVFAGGGKFWIHYGDGSFDAPEYIATGVSFDDTYQILDMNGDGYPDIFSQFGFYRYWANTFLQNEGGHFSSVPDIRESYYVMLRMMPGDLNGDGRPDMLILAENTEHRGELLFIDDHQANGVDAIRPLTPLVESNIYNKEGTGLVVADLDGDGRPDISTNYTSFLNDGETFHPVAAHSMMEIMTPWRTTHQRDLTGDGQVDQLSVSPGVRSLYMNASNGDGSFSRQRIWHSPDHEIMDVEIVNVNDDGLDDIVLLTEFDDRVYAYQLINDGSGGFGNTSVIFDGEDQTISYACDYPYPLVFNLVADLNNDRYEDVFLSSYIGVYCLGGDTNRLYVRNDAGFLHIVDTVDFIPDISDLYDFDYDGDLDLKGNTWWAVNDGSGNFDSIFPWGVFMEQFVDDIDGDGIVDMYRANNRFLWARNDGSNYDPDVQPYELEVIAELPPAELIEHRFADLDNDGDKDLIIASTGLEAGYPGLVIFENPATPTITAVEDDPLQGDAVIRVFPNPAHSLLYIDGLPEDADYRIVDVLGKVHRSGSIAAGGSQSVHVGDLDKAVYILVLDIGTEKLSFPIVRQ